MTTPTPSDRDAQRPKGTEPPVRGIQAPAAPPSPAPPSGVRASHANREEVARILHAAAG